MGTTAKTLILNCIILEVFVVKVNTSDSKVFEETVTFDVEKTSKKTDGDSGIVEIKYVGRKPKPTRTVSVTVPVVQRKPRRHDHHLRKRCCTAGELAGKHGFSCLITRNFRHQFFNMIAEKRQKVTESNKFRSKSARHIYNKIRMCVKRSKRSIVQKCCIGYKRRRRYQG